MTTDLASANPPLHGSRVSVSRCADLQGHVIDVLVSLLAASGTQARPSIERAVDRLGQLTGADRITCYSLDAGSADPKRRHGWCAAGIEDHRATRPALGEELVARWRTHFDDGLELWVPDAGALPASAPEATILSNHGIKSLLALPLIESKDLKGLLCLEMLGRPHSFLPVELHSIRSVADAIALVQARRERDAQRAALHQQEVTATFERTREIQLLSEIARRTTNLVVVTDASGCVDWVNDAFEQTTGYRLREVRGRPVGAVLFSGSSDTSVLVMMQDAMQTGSLLQVEIMNRTRDGQQCWMAISMQPLRDAAGVLQGFMAVGTNVTERRRDADALRRAAEEAAQAHASLEAAVNALQDGFALFNAEDRLVIFNQKYRDIYFRSAPAIVEGATFESILKVGLEKGKYADAIGREADWLAERMARHHSGAREFEQHLSDGRWLRIFEKSTWDGGRVSLSVDITELKTSEQQALADRWSAMDASQDGIAIADREGKFQYMNRSHLEMFGFADEAEVIGLPWSILYGPSEAAWIETHGLAALRERGRWSGEVMGRAKDGKAVDLDVSLTLKQDGGIVAIVRDMQQRRLEASERARIREELHLAQRREIVGQLAAGLAHDFNNLLAAIAGSASLISTVAEAGSLAATSAARIEAASFQATGLVKRLLTLGARQPEQRLLDLRVPVQEAATLLRASLNKAVDLTVRVPASPVWVMADPSDILQVVLNLVINASDALGGGDGQIAVRLAEAEPSDMEGPVHVGKLDHTQRHVVLSVADTGCGMTAELISRIFMSYVSTKGDKGTGLGLSIVASVVATNGGAIRVSSEPGCGTHFAILWPVDGPRAAPVPLSADGLTGRLDGVKILVTDDQQEVLDVLTALLEAAGAEVAPSTEPADILDAVEADPNVWDLVLTDLDMPGIGGEALARAVRDFAPSLPVILITARAGITRWHLPVFEAILSKPVDREKLILAVEAAMTARS